MSMHIDKTSPLPLYYQLKDFFMQQIESGILKPGEKIPSENEIVEMYKISRPTVRQALAALTNEGYLIKLQGLGTYVQEKRISNNIFQRMTSFTTEMLAQGIEFTTKVLNMEIQHPSDLICEKLSLQPSDLILYLERIRFIKDMPIYFSQTHLAYKFCSGLENEDLEHKSLYSLLTKEYGCELNKARILFKAIAANSYEAKILGVKKNVPLHLLEGLVFKKEKMEVIPLEYHWTRYRADKNQFCFEIEESNNNNALFYIIDDK
jgi:Transcriptional regulators